MSVWMRWVDTLVLSPDVYELILHAWFVVNLLDLLAAVMTFIASHRMKRLNGEFSSRLSIGLALIACESLSAVLALPWLLNAECGGIGGVPLAYLLMRFAGRTLKMGGQWWLAIYFLG